MGKTTTLLHAKMERGKFGTCSEWWWVAVTQTVWPKSNREVGCNPRCGLPSPSTCFTHLPQHKWVNSLVVQACSYITTYTKLHKTCDLWNFRTYFTSQDKIEDWGDTRKFCGKIGKGLAMWEDTDAYKDMKSITSNDVHDDAIWTALNNKDRDDCGDNPSDCDGKLVSG